MLWDEDSYATLSDMLSLIGGVLLNDDDGIAKARAIVVLLGENPDIGDQDLTGQVKLG